MCHEGEKEQRELLLLLAEGKEKETIRRKGGKFIDKVADLIGKKKTAVKHRSTRFTAKKSGEKGGRDNMDCLHWKRERKSGRPFPRQVHRRKKNGRKRGGRKTNASSILASVFKKRKDSKRF